MADTVMTDILDQSIAQVESSGQILQSDDLETVRLRQILASHVDPFLSDNAIQSRLDVPVFLHDRPIYNAVARQTKDGLPFIIIYDGLLQCFTYRASLYTLFHSVQRTRGAKEECDLKTLMVQATSLAYWFYLSGEHVEFPNIHGVLGDEHRQQVQVAISSISAFVVMHEVGHIKLGHLSSSLPPLPQICSSLEFEESNQRKAMELEADTFALSSFKKEFMPGMAASVLMLFDLASDLEYVCLPRSGLYPLMSNRLQNLINVTGIADDPNYRDHIEFLRQAKRTVTMERLRALNDIGDLVRLVDAGKAISNFKSLLPKQDECMQAVKVLMSLYSSSDHTE